jgi:pimeloyl-ACP methyl ester carboxylesterase
MAHFLLIHGSCHGAWCWRDVLPILRGRSHKAEAIDLPSHGGDKTPIDEVTLDLYARAMLAEISEPVILVGHSMAGFPITLAAELAPERVKKLVYLGAYVPLAGQSLVEMRQGGPSQPLRDAIIVAPDGKSFTIDPQKAREKFYHDCPEEAVAYAIPRLGPQPIKPQATPVNTTDRSGRIESHYIICDDDGTIPPVYQMMMSSHFPRNRVYNMPTSHSPFFAAPELLADRLIQIAES